MRNSLKMSVLDSPVTGFERYPKGSIVLCHACSKPIAKLDRGIDLGAKAGRFASAFVPMNHGDLQALADREDLDAGVRAFVTSLTPEQKLAHLAALHEFRSGDPMLCPICGGCFVQVLSVDKSEVLDRAYTIELLTIPPPGQKAIDVRGKTLGYSKDWVHDHPEVIH